MPQLLRGGIRKLFSHFLNVTSLVILIIIAVGIFTWLIMSDAPVVYNPPPRPALPRPNAYDTYLKASKSLVNVKQIDKAFPYSKKGPEVSSLTHAEKQAMVKANAKALNILREGLKQDCMLPSGMRMIFPDLSGLRKLSRAVALEALVYKESGENGKAMMTCMDGLEFGNDVAKGGNVLANLASIAYQSIARKNIWGVEERLNLADTRMAIARLNGIISEAVPFKTTMIEESHSFLTVEARLFFNARNWRQQYASADFTNKLLERKPLTLQNRVHYSSEYAKTSGLSRRGLFAGVQNDYAKQIAAAGMSYVDSTKLKIPGSNKISRMIMPVFGKARFKYEDNRCLNDLLLLQLALHAYKLEHGRYPVMLGDLAPGYLKSIPMDPFDTGNSYKYKLTSNGYKLYSLGPDLKDDGGKPVIQRDKPNARFVDIDGKGDIVAGYNQ